MSCPNLGLLAQAPRCWAASPAFRSTRITHSHLETIRVNKGAAESPEPRSASPHPPGHHSRSGALNSEAAPQVVVVRERDASASVARMHVDCHVPILGPVFGLARASERVRFTDRADGVRSTMLALSLSELVFGLLINRTLSLIRRLIALM